MMVNFSFNIQDHVLLDKQNYILTFFYNRMMSQKTIRLHTLKKILVVIFTILGGELLQKY